MCLISFQDILVLVSLQKPDIYCCIHSCRDRLGFYAESQIIFGTVLAYQYATGRLESSCVCVCCSVAQACDKSSYRDSVKMMNDASEVKIRIREKYIVQITPAFKCTLPVSKAHCIDSCGRKHGSPPTSDWNHQTQLCWLLYLFCRTWRRQVCR